MLPTANDFRTELLRMLDAAASLGCDHVEIRAGDLHQAVGGYPANGRHRMPTCCDVMIRESRAGDVVVERPPKGKGASLKIRYRLPR